MIQNIKGTKDILPSEVRKWQRLESVFRSITDVFGYEEIRTPIIEYSELFIEAPERGAMSSTRRCTFSKIGRTTASVFVRN